MIYCNFVVLCHNFLQDLRQYSILLNFEILSHLSCSSFTPLNCNVNCNLYCNETYNYFSLIICNIRCIQVPTFYIQFTGFGVAVDSVPTDFHRRIVILIVYIYNIKWIMINKFSAFLIIKFLMINVWKLHVTIAEMREALDIIYIYTYIYIYKYIYNIYIYIYKAWNLTKCRY